MEGRIYYRDNCKNNDTYDLMERAFCRCACGKEIVPSIGIQEADVLGARVEHVYYNY
jgi:hypothetical protein